MTTCNFTTRKLSELKSVLHNQNLIIDQNRVVYYVFRGAHCELPEHPDWRPNITVLTPQKMGQEYPKTFGHYHEHGEKETYLILQGEGWLVIQKPKKDNPVELEDFQILKGKTGGKLEVPGGYGHCLVNPSGDLLVTADWEPESAGHVYDNIKQLHGMGYYIIEENDQPKLVKNENYQLVPEIKLE